MPNVIGDCEAWIDAQHGAPESCACGCDLWAELSTARRDGDRERLAGAVARLLEALDRVEFLRAEIAARVRATEAELDRIRLYGDDLGRSSRIDPPPFR